MSGCRFSCRHAFAHHALALPEPRSGSTAPPPSGRGHAGRCLPHPAGVALHLPVSHGDGALAARAPQLRLGRAAVRDRGLQCGILGPARAPRQLALHQLSRHHTPGLGVPGGRSGMRGRHPDGATHRGAACRAGPAPRLHPDQPVAGAHDRAHAQRGLAGPAHRRADQRAARPGAGRWRRRQAADCRHPAPQLDRGGPARRRSRQAWQPHCRCHRVGRARPAGRPGQPERCLPPDPGDAGGHPGAAQTRAGAGGGHRSARGHRALGR